MTRRVTKYPVGLGDRGRMLWRDVTTTRNMGPGDSQVLLEACRLADRLDKLDLIIRGDVDTWAELAVNQDQTIRVAINGAVAQARLHAATLTALLQGLGIVKTNARGGPDPSPSPAPEKGGTGLANLRLAYSAGNDASNAEASADVPEDSG